MILVVSWPGDEHATPVLDRLRRMGVEARLLDLSRFPRELAVRIDVGDDGVDGRFSGGGLGSVALADCEVVWWRRPQPFDLHPALTGDDWRFAYGECQAALDGLWMTTDAVWVNDPTRDTVASRKVHQLDVATAVGFEVPETLVTNSPADARAFVEAHGPASTVYKPFSGTERVWRETRVFRPGEVDLLDDVRYAPVIFQEYVPAGADLRITVMGDDLFTGAIDTGGTSYEADFRMVMAETRVEPFDLPDAVADRVRALVDRLGLVYGAIDVRRTPDDRYVFLEINPAGQWLFVEADTGYPMTETFARLLADRAG